MADYSDYYALIACAISGLPSKTEEARGAVYERARTALQNRLNTFDPPLSETDLAIERFALEAAIQRVEMERLSDSRRAFGFISTLMQIVRSVGDNLDNNTSIRGDSLKASMAAGLAQGSALIQRTRLTATTECFFKIFGGARRITKSPQIRIAVHLLVAALVGIFGAIFVHWMAAENNEEAKSHSLISPSELALSDVTLNHPDQSPGGWELKGTIKNNSPRTLSGLRLKITIRDCANESGCVTIGEEVKHVIIDIPSSQTRIIDEGLFSSEMSIPKKLEWSYQIVETDAT